MCIFKFKYHMTLAENDSGGVQNGNLEFALISQTKQPRTSNKWKLNHISQTNWITYRLLSKCLSPEYRVTMSFISEGLYIFASINHVLFISHVSFSYSFLSLPNLLILDSHRIFLYLEGYQLNLILTITQDIHASTSSKPRGDRHNTHSFSTPIRL